MVVLDYWYEGIGAGVLLFVWLWLVVNDRKFPVGIVFFSHTKRPAVLLHEPATKRISQPNRLFDFGVELYSLSYDGTKRASLGALFLLLLCSRIDSLN